MHHNQHIKKRTAFIDPLPQRTLCTFENDDNSGQRLLTGTDVAYDDQDVAYENTEEASRLYDEATPVAPSIPTGQVKTVFPFAGLCSSCLSSHLLSTWLMFT